MPIAPYSNIHVGATVLCDDGSVVDGCNVENASYGLSICAEWVALFTAVSQGKRPPELTVSCDDAQPDVASGSRMPSGNAGTFTCRGQDPHLWGGAPAYQRAASRSV